MENLIIFVDNPTILLDNLKKKSTRMDEFSTVEGNKINKQNSIVFLLSGNEKLAMTADVLIKDLYTNAHGSHIFNSRK